MRVPVPVWFAAVAFTVLLVEPQIGSPAAHHASTVVAAPCVPSEDAAQRDAEYWLGYRAASRVWSAPKPDHARVNGVGAAPTVLR